LNESWTIALEALSWVELQKINEDAALSRTVKQLRIKDRRATKEAGILLYEVMKRRNTLDYLINVALEPRKIGDLDVGLRSFLRLYTFMIHYSGNPYLESHRLSEHVRGILGAKKLRPVEEAIDLISHIELPWSSFSHDEELAYRYFHPIWYVNYLHKHFDEQNVVNLIRPFDTPKYIRLNTLKADESLPDSLRQQGFQLEKVPGLICAYRVLDSSKDLTNTELCREGAFIVQDKASILAGEVASPKPQDVVLDICAAPGVKTSHLAQLMGNQGRIISVDYDERRLISWKRLIDKLGVTNAEPILGDATKLEDLPKEKADLVMLDPPCSGTGTFNDAPSGKWRITRRSINRMAGLQRRLIENAALHVKEGGSLVYCTCSVTVEENEGVIKGFLECNPAFRLIEAEPRIGAQGLLGLAAAQRLYPYMHECEGFFVAKLVKN
jgi:16S rRNA (cytosine967-C5)-methyltransferase